MAAKILRHAIDTLNNRKITGWCYSRIQPEKAITLSIYFGKKLIGKVISNEFRQDLFEHAFHPRVNAASLSFSPKIFRRKKNVL
ncbi:MAG: hypothetical protein D3908_07195 [Candidatus Electrothrix sp. AUS4]|nr:hypothetical protein [Candidatus Electrothrix sp. AUS4]